ASTAARRRELARWNRRPRTPPHRTDEGPPASVAAEASPLPDDAPRGEQSELPPAAPGPRGPGASATADAACGGPERSRGDLGSRDWPPGRETRWLLATRLDKGGNREAP